MGRIKTILLCLLLLYPVTASADWESNTTAYINTSYTPNLGASDDFSWAARYELRSTPGGQWNVFGAIVSNNAIIQLTYNGNDTPTLYLRDDDNNLDGPAFSNTDTVVGTFYTVMAVYDDGAATYRLYVNGTETGNVTSATAVGAKNFTVNNRYFYLGARNNGGTTDTYANITMDWWGFWNGTAVNATVISEVSSGTATPCDHGASIYYNLTDGANNTAADGDTVAYECGADGTNGLSFNGTWVNIEGGGEPAAAPNTRMLIW